VAAGPGPGRPAPLGSGSAASAAALIGLAKGWSALIATIGGMGPGGVDVGLRGRGNVVWVRGGGKGEGGNGMYMQSGVGCLVVGEGGTRLR
jgi:hypothetical protein